MNEPKHVHVYILTGFLRGYRCYECRECGALAYDGDPS